MKWGRNIVIAAVAAGTLLTANTVSAQRSMPMDPNTAINVPYTLRNTDTGEVVSAGGATPEMAAPAAEPVQASAATANRNSNLRSGPGTNHGVVGHAQSGQALRPVSRNADGSWLQLSDGTWIAAFLVNNAPAGLLVAGAAPAPAAAPAATSGGTTAAAPTGGQTSNDAHSYLDKGAAYYDLGDYTRALTELNVAIRLNPGLAEAYGYRGLIYLERGNYANAVNEFSMVIQIDPSSAIAYAGRGIAHANLDNVSQAIQDMERAMQLGVPAELQPVIEGLLLILRA